MRVPERETTPVEPTPEQRVSSDTSVRKAKGEKHTNGSRGKDGVGQDANLATTVRTGSDHTGTVGSYETRLCLTTKDLSHANFILLRDSFGNANDQRDFGLNGFNDGICGERRRNVDDCGVGSGLVGGLEEDGSAFASSVSERAVRESSRRTGQTYLLDGTENGETQVLGTSLLWADTTNNLGTKVETLLAVEGGLRKWERRAQRTPGQCCYSSFQYSNNRLLTVFPL